MGKGNGGAVVGGSYGVLAVDTACFVCEKGGMSCEAVDNKRQGGATIVAEEEHGRGIKEKNWYGSWE